MVDQRLRLLLHQLSRKKPAQVILPGWVVVYQGLLQRPHSLGPIGYTAHLTGVMEHLVSGRAAVLVLGHVVQSSLWR